MLPEERGFICGSVDASVCSDPEVLEVLLRQAC